MKIFNTQSFQLIHKACTQSLEDKCISIVVGAKGTGKTVALMEFCENRNDAVLIGRTPTRKMIFSERTKLIVIDGLKMQWAYFKVVHSLIEENPDKGFVISMNYNPFLSTSEAVRKAAYSLVSGRSEVVEIIANALDYTLRTRIKLTGSVKALKNDREFKRHFVITLKLKHSPFPVLKPEEASDDRILKAMCGYKMPKGLNTINILRRPSRRDVQDICKFFSMTSSSSSIYQTCDTLSEV